MATEEEELIKKGEARLEWARERMKVLGEVREHLRRKGNLKGVRVGMALHTEAKTGVLAETIHEAGAEVCLTSCNPLSTDDCVAAALRESRGIKVYAKRGQSQEQYYESLNRVIDFEPDFIIDDGADLIFLLHTKRNDKLDRVKGANEETTTGIIRLRAMAQEGVLRFPVMSVNDAMMKHLFDNRYGTGQSTFDGIMSSTNLLIAGRRLVVAGYGWCGRGIAMRAKGLGARVAVTEVDPVRAIEANLDGFDVCPMAEAVEQADFVVTATGCKDILRKEHFERMKSGCVLANSGHFDNEISKTDLDSISSSVRRARDNVTEYELADGKKIFLIAEGRLVNLAAGQGHPVEIMDMSFSLQAMALGYLVDNHDKLSPQVHSIPKDVDEWIARVALEGMGLSIDSLSDEQRGYLCGWREGT